MSDTPSNVDMPEVSWTALGAAWTRAREGDRPDALFTDPLAAHFITAVGGEAPYIKAGEQARADADADPLANPFTAMGDYVALRTRWLDDLLRDAAADGIRQVVLLAAGLDTRAYRLDWPAGLRLFELDLPELVSFKENVLRAHDARPACDRIAVSFDLRDGWSTALRTAGFDPTRPTVWLAEGLLHYLTPEDNQAMLDDITALSAPGSQLATDHIEADMMGGSHAPTADSTGLKYDRLVKGGPGTTPATWLERSGWQAEEHAVADCAVRHGRPIPPLLDPDVPGSVKDGAVFLSARWNGPRTTAA
ncbi:SAM-dependent methyltransferase [Streptomyces sp. NRRL F-5727]|uniref:SAM-dependent methyltransferase n=1 Tax=Streptomyces sp. NRRL F-5727 TaxID=1463871 RepID=UPI0004CAE1BB|nr:SAM-dependent methyltransferase [Streptomyces sp. NRRL F-5727]